MTFSFHPPSPARHNIRRHPAVPAVVALLLSALASPAFAQTAVTAPIAAFSSTVDSVVSKVNGPVLDVLDGALQIDVTNAKILGGDDRLANPVPWSGILAGSRVVAQVAVPDVIPAVFPPRLVATNVVVFLANTGSLSGLVQGVAAAQGTFSLLFTNVMTNAATEWLGAKADGAPVKGLSDLSAGMQANAVVTYDASGVTAKSVYAFATPATRIEAFRGKVEAEGPTQWTIGGRVVQVNADTKIAGDPRIGDTVDVLVKAPVLPPGAGTATIPVAISIIKVVATPPPPSDRTVEFDGVVEAIPPATGASLPPMGHWTISGKDVLVTPLTKVDSGIAKGSSVHVKGVTLPMAVFAPAATPHILATEITKK